MCGETNEFLSKENLRVYKREVRPVFTCSLENRPETIRNKRTDMSSQHEDIKFSLRDQIRSSAMRESFKNPGYFFRLTADQDPGAINR